MMWRSVPFRQIREESEIKGYLRSTDAAFQSVLKQTMTALNERYHSCNLADHLNIIRLEDRNILEACNESYLFPRSLIFYIFIQSKFNHSN